MSPRQRFQARRTRHRGSGVLPDLHGQGSLREQLRDPVSLQPGTARRPPLPRVTSPFGPCAQVLVGDASCGMQRAQILVLECDSDSPAYARDEGVPAGLSAGLSPSLDSESSRTPRVTHPGRPEELFWERKAHWSLLNSWSPSPGSSGCARGAVPGRAVDWLQVGIRLLCILSSP